MDPRLMKRIQDGPDQGLLALCFRVPRAVVQVSSHER